MKRLLSLSALALVSIFALRAHGHTGGFSDGLVPPKPFERYLPTAVVHTDLISQDAQNVLIGLFEELEPLRPPEPYKTAATPVFRFAIGRQRNADLLANPMVDGAKNPFVAIFLPLDIANLTPDQRVKLRNDLYQAFPHKYVQPNRAAEALREWGHRLLSEGRLGAEAIVSVLWAQKHLTPAQIRLDRMLRFLSFGKKDTYQEEATGLMVAASARIQCEALFEPLE